jgi:hypothetical protein
MRREGEGVAGFRGEGDGERGGEHFYSVDGGEAALRHELVGELAFARLERGKWEIRVRRGKLKVCVRERWEGSSIRGGQSPIAAAEPRRRTARGTIPATRPIARERWSWRGEFLL